MSRPDAAEVTALYGDDRPEEAQRVAFVDGEVPVAVYGLGKMGLPLAAVYAEVTGNVVGVDVDEAVVAAVSRGESPVENEPGLDEAVATAVADGALSATTDPAVAAGAATVHVVVVPTLVDDRNRPDLSTLRDAVTGVAAGLAPGDLVVVESTVPPGTCETVVAPILERVSGLDADDFGVAHCPERTMSGRALRDVRGAYPKIVGGTDAEAARASALVYDELTDNEVHVVTDATTAECVKVFEGVYRDVNIALANELATFADELDADVLEAIDAANTQPYCDIHAPGPGVGGHCIPYYPHFLIDSLETPSPLLETAREVNESMPAFTVEKTVEGLEAVDVDPADASVAVLGVAYRPGVDETRASPAHPIIRTLAERVAEVYVVDPVVDEIDVDAGVRIPAGDLADVEPDAVVLVTAHEAFEHLDWSDLGAGLFVDGRQALPDVPGAVYTIGVGFEN